MVLGALALVAAAILALEGLGALVAAAAARPAGGRPSWDVPGVRGALGVVVVALVSGVAAPAGIPMEIPFFLLAAAGLAGAGWLAWRARPPAGARRGLAVRVAILAVLGAWVTLWALAQPVWNACDDAIAYLPFGDALLSGEGLDQPFSQRRMGSLMAFLPMQLIGSMPFGPYGAAFGDALVCPLLAAAALLWSGRRWTGLAIGAAGALVAVLGPLGRINLGPNGVSLLLMVALAIVAMRALEEEGRARTAAVAVAAALGGTLVAFRLHYGLLALAPLALLVLAGPGGDRLRRTGAAAATAVVVLAGWCVASWQASGTPLFPILGDGTLSPDWPGYRDPEVGGAGELTGRALDVLAQADTGVALVAVLVVSALMALHPRHPRRFAVPLALAAAAAASVVVFPMSLTTAPVVDSGRLTRPLVVASVLALVAALAMTVGERRARWRSEEAWPLALAAAAGASLALWLGQVPWSDVIAKVRALDDGIAAAREFERDPFAPVRPDYEALTAALPRGAAIAYAVDAPTLLEGAGRRGRNLDILGANSPDPGMPFFSGPEAKARYLRGEGVTHLVTVDPAASACLYARAAWEANRTGELRVYQLWAPYFLDWFDDADAIARSPGTRAFGPLRLTPLASRS
jgi:hypothetical protein